METFFRYFAALYLAKPVPLFSKECRVVVTKMKASPRFSSLSALLDDTETHLDSLDAAEIVAHNGPKGSAAKRNAARLVVRGDMLQLKSGVQVAADADGTHATEIIEESGMYVVIRGKKGKPDLSAVRGGAVGLVDLFARRIKGQGVYEWQMSVDQVVWSDLPKTVYASTSVAGLTPMTTVYFRYRTFTKAGYSPWSAAVSIIVL
jgi:hypothetical protein